MRLSYDCAWLVILHFILTNIVLFIDFQLSECSVCYIITCHILFRFLNFLCWIMTLSPILRQGYKVSVKELDSLLSLLAEKKRKLKQEESETNMQITLDFLIFLRNQKQEEFNEVSNLLRFIPVLVTLLSSLAVDFCSCGSALLTHVLHVIWWIQKGLRGEKRRDFSHLSLMTKYSLFVLLSLLFLLGG